MRIVIPGGSGQVGQMLARHFHGEGHGVTVLSRKPMSQKRDPSTGSGQAMGHPDPWRVVDLQDRGGTRGLGGWG